MALEDRTVPATFWVSNVADSGAGSLRQAIDDANKLGGADTIMLDSGAFGTVLSSSTLSITDPVYINAPVADAFTVQLVGAGPVFSIDKPGSSGMQVTINGGGIVGGTASGIYLQDENLTLVQTVVTGNAGSRGGGIYVKDSAASLTLINATIDGNTASSHGGGVYFFSGGSLFVENSTISGNKSSGGAGGGIYFFGAAGGGTLTVRNSTISGNSSNQEGGGIALRTFTGTLLVQNSTITNNSASSVGGGGIARNSVGGGVITIESTVVSGNMNATAADIVSAGTVNVNFSAIGQAAGFTLTGANNLAFGTDLNLEPLAKHGGPTQTHAPAFDSPLINGGSNPAGLTTDQRGNPAARVSSGAADIGAFEQQNFIVTNANDSGSGSLRQALANANALAPSPDYIYFNNYFSLPRTITLFAGELEITDSVYVIGNYDTSLITINGNNATRLFNVNGPGSLTVEIAGMTLTGGNAINGGAIFNADEALNLVTCNIVGNKATRGGGVYVDTGGSLYSSNESSVSGNTAEIHGGGIYFFNSGSLDLRDSTVAGNTAVTGTGGGVYFFGSATGGYASIYQTTISGNTAGSYGGGITLNNFLGTFRAFNSTITKNSSQSGGGGGIARPTGTGSIQLTSSIVSGNASAAGPDLFSAGSVTADHSAIGSSGGFALGGGANNLPYGVDLKLGPLADNGSQALTHMPAPDSPVVNKGSNLVGWTWDQRGIGYPRELGGAPDIGAVELKDLVVRNANDSGPGSLRQAILDANAAFGDDNVQFDYSFFNSPRTINLSSGELVITESVTILETVGGLVSVDAKGLSRVFRVETSLSGGDVRFIGLTITGGNAFNGGAVEVSNSNAIVRLSHCTVTGNSASGNGGGVFVASAGILDLQVTTIANNSAGNHGGGIYFYQGGNLSAQYCTISGNKALGGAGGGIYFFSQAIYPLSIHNTTISGNSAYSEGGGIALRTFNGTLSLLSCTVTENKAFASFGGAGGGISNNSSSGSLVIESTIVSGNSNSIASDIFSVGSVSLNYSAVGDSKGFTWSGGNNLPFGTNLYLGPLQNNGGTTQTHGFDPEVSPLVNAGSNAAGTLDDQRGGNRVSFGQADIGAFEQQFYFVTNANDSGPGSLREAVGFANALTPSSDWVIFDPTFFTTAKTITLTTGDITITDSTIINGNYALGRVTISGNNSSRIFTMQGDGTPTVELYALTLTGGNGAGSLQDSGGAIYCRGTNLVLYDCLVTGNKASYGGGVYLEIPSSTLTVENSTISNNTANNWGGGIESEGGHSIIIRNSTIVGNSASYGGGLSQSGGPNSLEFRDSTISGNKATNSGGGLILRDSFTAMIIRNSTISANTAGNIGGGANLQYFGATAVIENSTFTLNSANQGGGIARESGIGLISLESTIISGNSAKSAGPDLYTTGTVNAKTSLIGSISGITTFVPDAVTTLLLGKAPLLGPLQNNGGLTQTHGLLVGSPAINNGSNPAGVSWDQRGTGFARSVGAGPDIGAFEVQQTVVSAKVISVEINGGAAQRSRVTTLKVSLDNPLMLPPNPADAFQLNRNSDNAAVTLNAVVAGNAITLTFTGGAVNANSLADGRYTLTILAAQAPNLDGDGDGTPGGNYVLVGNPATAPKLYRLFGDVDGDNDVDTTDFGAFRGSYGGSNNVFDFDNDGDVDTSDFGQFRTRFGASI